MDNVGSMHIDDVKPKFHISSVCTPHLFCSCSFCSVPSLVAEKTWEYLISKVPIAQ